MPRPHPVSKFQQELTALINRYSIENASNTPDFVLADYLTGCLTNFNQAVNDRERGYGREAKPVESFPVLIDHASPCG